MRLPNSESFRSEFDKSFLSSGFLLQLPSCRFQYTTLNSFVKESIYAAMGNKKTVQGKFQLGKRHIGQLFQLFNGRSGVLLFQIRGARRLTARAGERPLLSR